LAEADISGMEFDRLFVPDRNRLSAELQVESVMIRGDVGDLPARQNELIACFRLAHRDANRTVASDGGAGGKHTGRRGRRRAEKACGGVAETSRQYEKRSRKGTPAADQLMVCPSAREADLASLACVCTVDHVVCTPAIGAIYTSFALAALVGPTLAGLLRDHYGNYDAALAVCAVLSFATVAASAGVRSRY
jgi:hypothetical protein